MASPSGTGHDTAKAAPAPHPRRLEDAALLLAHRAEYVAEHIMDSGLAPRLQMLRDAVLDVRREVERARTARRSDLPPVAVPGPASAPQNVTEGMPPELVRALRDPTIRLPQDDYVLADGRSLWEHLQEWRNAPSNTASGDPGPASVSPAETPCSECGGREEVPVTPGQPGDGSMPCPRCADPVVSPADTIRRLTEWLDSAPDSFPSYRMHEPTYRNPGDLRRDVRALLAVGERDRQQIARLTEAATAAMSELRAPRGLEVGYDHAATRAYAIFAAVLAGEEDART